MRCAGVFAVVSLGIGAAVLPHRALADNVGSDDIRGPEIRARGVYLDTHAPISDQAYPELSAEIFIAARWSTEIAVGHSAHFHPTCCVDYSFGMTPLTWTVKYSFPPAQRLHPYLGFGWQHTGVTATQDYRTSSILWGGSSSGWAAQVGFDVLLSRHWFLNLDGRYLDNLDAGRFRVDPFLIGIGIAAAY
jgi:outer membrane protein